MGRVRQGRIGTTLASSLVGAVTLAAVWGVLAGQVLAQTQTAGQAGGQPPAAQAAPAAEKAPPAQPAATSAAPAASPATPSAQAAPAAASPATSAPAAGSQGKSSFQFHPRLPMYYGRVVTEEQRQKIYAIQRDYHPRIAALRKQLEDLLAEQNAKIEAVLSPQQKAELDKIKAEAAARRKSPQTESSGQE